MTAPTGDLCHVTLVRDELPALREDELVLVEFAFNPEKLTFSHTARSEDITNLADAEAQIKNLGNLEITIDKVVMTGPQTKDQCTTLLWWSTPATSGIGKQMTTTPITLTFAWGTWRERVRLRQATVSYTRFAVTGMPIRAEVRLNLYRGMDPLKPFTNPTSGGPAGRSAHMIDSSECLPSVAADRYGGPGAWRQIARANAVDDPLRVRPGTLLYLPEPGASDLRNGARP